ncbi:MAG: GNAT family N-acetyltransferase [Parasporobacterium sp.]|nr:GNAT family N-acetyltransferase [Parasporobacterium sp.]
MYLFDEMPYLKNEVIELRQMTKEDAKQLEDFCRDRSVYTYLPTFLYEQKYQDPLLAIDHMREECFDTGESILLGIYPVNDPGRFMGIAEFYDYDRRKNKVSIGCRLAKEYWYQGIAYQAIWMMMEYLEQKIRIRTVTLHIMTHNKASQKLALKLGFEKRYENIWEDWGREGPVLVDKYVFQFKENPKMDIEKSV